MSHKFDDLVKTTQAFLHIIANETSYLLSHGLEKAHLLLPEKKRLSKEHQEQLTSFTRQDEQNRVLPEQSEQLNLLLIHLGEALLQNHQALKIVYGAQEHVIHQFQASAFYDA